MGIEEEEYMPLFETKESKRKLLHRLFVLTVFLAICLIWAYRISHIPREGENGRWVWIGLLGAELWFGLYWVLTQAVRWNQVRRFTFKDRLSQRYEDDDLPRVDVFVCTANPEIEPTIMVINTVLSVMAYDYPSEKLSVYLSDDGGSILTFYALLEASKFATQWIPYCKKFNVEPRSPAAYFVSLEERNSLCSGQVDEDLVAIKKLYDEMGERIETATKLGRIPEEELSKHRGFTEWASYLSQNDHGTILQILIDGKDSNAVDMDGCAVPTLVYLAREKRPQHPNNFKAGALNALIRVSSEISRGEVILNVDCDVYSNNSLSVKDALCFFMDERKSHDIGYVLFPPGIINVTKNDLYGALFLVPNKVEVHGMDGFGGPLYLGSGSFHRRDALSGRKFTKDCKFEWKKASDDEKQHFSTNELEESAKIIASCTYEQNSQWGNEMGLKYGCICEDTITGLSIQCNGWKSVCFNPERTAFLGLAPTTLLQTLIQHKRWSEGHFQVFFSKYNPIWYAYGKISLGLQLCYCCYILWAANCLATLYYTIFPSLCLLKGISLFPQVSSPWFFPFAYAILAKCTYSLAEFMWYGGTFLGWWNEQRMWLYKRTSSYLFAFVDTISYTLGFRDSVFVITAKVASENVTERYKKEIMELGVSSPMFTVLASLAVLNLACFVGVMKKVIIKESLPMDYLERLACQIVICGVLVVMNWPLYEGIFFRKDKGKLPGSVSLKSLLFAFIICTSFTFLL